MRNWKLYEVADVLRQAVAAADAVVDMETGELPEDWAKFLDDVQMERDEKALNVAAMVRELKAESEAIAIERKRIQAREKAAERRAESLRSYLSAFVKPGEKLKDTRVAIGWTTRNSVEVSNPMAIPDEFCKIERTPMLREISAAILGGKPVPGASIVERTSLTIR